MSCPYTEDINVRIKKIVLRDSDLSLRFKPHRLPSRNYKYDGNNTMNNSALSIFKKPLGSSPQSVNFYIKRKP